MKDTYQVGSTILDGDGNEWVIGQRWVNGDWIDLALFGKNGERGDLRVKNNNAYHY